MNGQLTLDVLIRKGLVSEADFQKMANEITDKRKLKNILTKEELGEVAATLRNFRPPAPTGWAHALQIHSQKEYKRTFSPERPYGSTDLSNLTATLDAAGLRNETIFQKLKNAERLAEKYGF